MNRGLGDTPWGDWEHPVSGHREFGIERRTDGSYVFYTRAADRPTGRLDAFFQGLIFTSSDDVWKTVMERVAADIIRRRGDAKVGDVVTERKDWDQLLRGEKERASSPLHD